MVFRSRDRRRGPGLGTESPGGPGRILQRTDPEDGPLSGGGVVDSRPRCVLERRRSFREGGRGTMSEGIYYKVQSRVFTTTPRGRTNLNLR